MKSKFISVAVLAIAALASLGSYADGMGGRAPVPAPSVVTTSSAVAKADLTAAKSEGRTIASDNNYPVVVNATESTGKTSSQTRAERTGNSSHSTYDNYLYSR
jgi:hypothetical protein